MNDRCCACKRPVPTKWGVVTDEMNATNRNTWTHYRNWVCPECAYNPKRKRHAKTTTARQAAV